jgi:acetyltransferase-like isoleucine patch superfamily enzyme
MIDAQADIFSRLKAGEAVRMDDPSIIGSTIDDSATVFPPFFTNVGRNIRIGKNVFINHACSFFDLCGITIEDDVLIGPKVNLITENHPLDPADKKALICKPIVIKQNAWIGAGATILRQGHSQTNNKKEAMYNAQQKE